MHGSNVKAHAALNTRINTIVDDTLLPFIRERYDAPDAYHCYSLLRRSVPDCFCLDRRLADAHARSLSRLPPGTAQGSAAA